MIGARAADWLGLLFVATIVYVLVRPQSRAAELVGAIGNMVAAIVASATDLGAGTPGGTPTSSRQRPRPVGIGEMRKERGIR